MTTVPNDSEIIIVSGLPRSGTSLMMQMLDRGGIPVLTDDVRTADPDNPLGYYEFEQVKRTKQDRSWIPGARGKAVKMVSSLLYDLPPTEKYRVIFMQRDLDEVLESQEKMLCRLGRPAAPREQMKASFLIHLQRLLEWLRGQEHMDVIFINYNLLLSTPEAEVLRLAQFLGGRAEADCMIGTLDQSLYRNRNSVVYIFSAAMAKRLGEESWVGNL